MILLSYHQKIKIKIKLHFKTKAFLFLILSIVLQPIRITIYSIVSTLERMSWHFFSNIRRNVLQRDNIVFFFVTLTRSIPTFRQLQPSFSVSLSFFFFLFALFLSTFFRPWEMSSNFHFHLEKFRNLFSTFLRDSRNICRIWINTKRVLREFDIHFLS